MTLARPIVLLLALLHVLPVRAHLPEPFGRELVPEPPQPVAAPRDPDADEGEPSALERTRELAAMEDALEAQQQEAGAYGGELTDPLLQIAAAYERDGNPVAALRSLERALHLLRVNNGLLHPVQLPVLRQIPELYRRIGDLASAQAAWRYAYRVNGLGRKALDSEALADTLAYFQFARDAFIAPGASRNARLLVQAYQDNDELLERYLENAQSDPDELRGVAMSHLRNLYILLGIDLSGAMGPMMGDAGSPGYERLYSLQSLGLGKGLDILDALDARAAAGPAMERVRLQLERANWLQWNAKWSRARDLYADTVVQLTALEADADAAVAGEAAALRTYLASPAALPEDPVLWRSLLGDDMPQRGVFSASFRVSRRGNAMEIQVTPVGDASDSLAGRVRRLLSDSHYRPALGDAGAEEGRVEDRRYRLVR